MTTHNNMYWQLYIGTYTQPLSFVDGQGEGIYTLQMDRISAELTAPVLAAHAVNPSFLTLHPSGAWLYAVGELESWRNKVTGYVAAYAIQPLSGSLRLLNRRQSQGAAPCYLSLASQALLVANYTSGTLARFSLNEDGSLKNAGKPIVHSGRGLHPTRQKGAHAHSIQPDPSGKWAIAADLGTDRLYVYRRRKYFLQLEKAVPVHPGAGPRHFTFSKDGRRLYLANELDSTVSTFAWDAGSCTLEETQVVSALPNGYAQENTLADIHIHPSGRWLYASNRGHNSLVVYQISPDGTLAPLGHISTQGRVPRNFALTPDGAFLIAANQDSHSLVVFRIDENTGLPRPTGITARLPSPVCVVVT